MSACSGIPYTCSTPGKEMSIPTDVGPEKHFHLTNLCGPEINAFPLLKSTGLLSIVSAKGLDPKSSFACHISKE